MTITADPSDGELIVPADYDPFALTFYKVDKSGRDDRYVVFHASKESLRFRPAGGVDDYHIAWRAQKPCIANYVGFGEKGGKDLVKNNTRVTYFNYDCGIVKCITRDRWKSASRYIISIRFSWK